VAIPALTESGKRVLGSLLEEGPSSRPRVSTRTGLSKQTVSIAMEELESLGLVEVVSSQQGHTGRSASVYGLGADSGWILGVDFGSTHVRLAATALDGDLILERDVAVSGSPSRANTDYGDDARDAVHALLGELTADRGPLLSVCVAFSRAVPRLKDWNAAPDPDDPADIREILATLQIPENVPFYAENNVNCAALSEYRSGHDFAHDDVVYLQVGMGIGAGIIADGRLVRGSAGQAGELRYLPSPFPGGDFDNAEEALGSAGILARFTASNGAPPRVTTAEGVFAEAAAGSESAQAVLREEAQGIAFLITALVAVSNPTAIVLGGGVGQNAALLPLIQAEIERRRLAVRIELGTLGESATVMGAADLARDLVVEEMIGSPGARHRPR
jgi:predicted NBD/HSP70 family sugar kinase